jgi:hypothetical protein
MPTVPGQYACSVYAITYRDSAIYEGGRLGEVKWTKPDGTVIAFDFYADAAATLHALNRFALEHVDDYRREDKGHPGDWKYKNEPARWEIYNRLRVEVMTYVNAALDAMRDRGKYGPQG